MSDHMSESWQAGLDDAPEEGNSTSARELGAGLAQTYPAAVESIAALRATVGDFAARAGASRATVERIKLAVSEAATNVLVHAYHADRSGLIHIQGSVAAGEVRITVADTGTGLRATDHDRPGLGLGLALISHLADNVQFLRGSTRGLRVLMSFALPARPRRP